MNVSQMWQYAKFQPDSKVRANRIRYWWRVACDFVFVVAYAVGELFRRSK